MTKSKRPIAKQRKRPKSVLKKAWETRRKNKQVKALAAIAAMPLEIDREAFLKDLGAELNKVQPQASKPPSDYDAIAHVLDVHRDEQLCSFMGDISAMRQGGHLRGHYPITVSRTQIEAIEDFLREHDYGPWGGGQTRQRSSTAAIESATKAA